jgi:ribosomal protein L37AE/L43A
MGESQNDAMRVNFGRLIKLEFHGSTHGAGPGTWAAAPATGTTAQVRLLISGGWAMYTCSRCGRNISINSIMDGISSCPHCGAYLDPKSVKEARNAERWSIGCGAGIVVFGLCMWITTMVIGRDSNIPGTYVMLSLLAALVVAVICRFFQTIGVLLLVTVVGLALYLKFYH